MYLSILAVVLLLAANAFFVAAEFALVKVRAIRLEALAAAGSRQARLASRILKHLEAYLAACQLGITMASLGLGWVGEPAVAALLEPLFRLAGPRRAAAAHRVVRARFPAVLLLHIVLGEQVPKTFAIRQPEPISLWIAAPLHALLPALLAAELGAQRRRPAASSACSGWPRPATARSSPAPSCAS